MNVITIAKLMRDSGCSDAQIGYVMAGLAQTEQTARQAANHRHYLKRRLNKTTESILPEAKKPLQIEPPRVRAPAPVLYGAEEELFKDYISGTNVPSESIPLSSEAKASSSAPKGAVDEKRGRRLPADWKPTDHHRLLGKTLGLNQLQFDEVVEEFSNYWHAEAGAKARKIDWDLTFTNRLKDQAKRIKLLASRSRPQNGSLETRWFDA
jgi:hypothetical protein